MVPTPTAETTQLQNSRVLSLQSTATPSGAQRVTTLVKVKTRLAVSVVALGLVRVMGTETTRVKVAKFPVVVTLLITVQEIELPVVRAQGIACPTVKVPVTNSPVRPVVTVVSRLRLSTWKQLS